MIDIQCRYCASTKYTVREKGPHTGAFCADCGKWIKWLGKNEKTAVSAPASISTPVISVNNEDNAEEVPW